MLPARRRRRRQEEFLGDPRRPAPRPRMVCAGLYRGAQDSRRNPDLRHARGEGEIRKDQADCMGCLSQCAFSSWADNEKNTTGRLADPRSFCIQKTLQDIAHGGPVEQNLMFAGHSAFRFKNGPVLLERLRADGEAAGRAHPDRRLSDAVLVSRRGYCCWPCRHLRAVLVAAGAAAARDALLGLDLGRPGDDADRPGQELSGNGSICAPICRCRSSKSIRAGARSRIRAATTGWMLQPAQRHPHRAGYRRRPRPLHEAADARSPVRYRAEPGVVGRISQCGDGWCRLDVGGRDGYIRTGHIWGVDRDERIG